jgi:KDO2-lipid IV(A) lauroyltransferase
LRGRLIILLLRAFAALPLPLSHGLGAVIGWGLILIPNDLRRAARVNIPLCLPELSRAQQRHLLRKSLIETGKIFCETGALWHWPPERLLALVKGIHGEERVYAALAQGKGVIFATPHLGSWEMIGLYGSTRFPITSLFRPPRLMELGALVRHSRERLGAKLVPVDATGVRALHQSLARGETIGILPDQDPGPGKGVFAPLFGIQANTMTLLSRLAIKTGAPVFVCYAERLPRGRGYYIHLLPAPPEINREPVARSVAILNRLVETLIRQRPEQYQWGYKRFRTRPDGEPRLYEK